MPILYSFEENKLEYKDEDEVEIKIMGTGMDKESWEHNLYENDITLIICHNFSLPIKPKDSGGFRIKKLTNGNLRTVVFEEKRNKKFFTGPGDDVRIYLDDVTRPATGKFDFYLIFKKLIWFNGFDFMTKERCKYAQEFKGCWTAIKEIIIVTKSYLPINENEIRIKSQGLVHNYIAYASTLILLQYKPLLIHSLVEEHEFIELMQQIDPKTRKPCKKKVLFMKNGAVVIYRIQVSNMICIENFMDFQKFMEVQTSYRMLYAEQPLQLEKLLNLRNQFCPRSKVHATVRPMNVALLVNQIQKLIVSFKRRRQDFYGEGATDLTTASELSRPKETLKDSAS
uniref:Eukaryotic peptide chain release factor GTP-binding subunit ERF3A n=1 Tax=Tanacetum cinerariifolium TaxID=118510 RepID=A0A6L2L1W3_TANCI|nr:eukaryotic peptide chain release factor GTP-binding subunit ERF3A [Tanacetum cinerariifolium]